MPKTKRAVINSASEIPQHFASEDEEREWWASHDFSDAFYDESSKGLEIANLELSVIRLQAQVSKLVDDNKALHDRLDELESKLSANGS